MRFARVGPVLAVAAILCGGCRGKDVEELETTAATPVKTITLAPATLEGIVAAGGVVAAAPGADWLIVRSVLASCSPSLISSSQGCTSAAAPAPTPRMTHVLLRFGNATKSLPVSRISATKPVCSGSGGGGAAWPWNRGATGSESAGAGDGNGDARGTGSTGASSLGS
jgi:hypothetical protein